MLLIGQPVQEKTRKYLITKEDVFIANFARIIKREQIVNRIALSFGFSIILLLFLIVLNFASKV